VRLFVAVEIDPAVARTIAEVGEELKRRVLARAPGARVTWIPSDRLHLTVRFIGEVDDERAAEIGAALGRRLPADAFELTMAGVGAFPTSGAPRVLWAGVSSGTDALVGLERDVSGRLAACEVDREDRAYRPHLTLARVRDAAGLRSRELLEGLTDRVFGTTRVDAITLFHSRLSPKGPTYVPLRRTILSRQSAVGSRQ
jgi:2'-5' RNA ligase